MAILCRIHFDLSISDRQRSAVPGTVAEDDCDVCLKYSGLADGEMACVWEICVGEKNIVGTVLAHARVPLTPPILFMIKQACQPTWVGGSADWLANHGKLGHPHVYP